LVTLQDSPANVGKISAITQSVASIRCASPC
jgi:hypothetical protein